MFSLPLRAPWVRARTRGAVAAFPATEVARWAAMVKVSGVTAE